MTDHTTKVQQAKELRREGCSFKEIAAILDSKPSTVWDWVMDRRRPTHMHGDIEEQEAIVGYVPPTPYIKPISSASEDAIDDLKDFIQQLAPIRYDAPPKPKVHETPNKYALVLGDAHFGTEDWDVLDIFLQTVKEIKPSTVILNGDTLDMFAVSRYPKDVRHSHSLLREREAYHKFLKQLHDITAPYQAKIYETNSNHSGDGTEGRWWRYLSDRIGEIADIPEVRDSLSYNNVFLPHASWSRVELVDYVEVVPGFIVMHGDVVRRHGGYSARGLFEKWFTSIMCNHTHRVGMTTQRIPSIGTQEERIIRVYENGCACNLKPLYASAANWQNAFSIVNYNDNDFAVETVIISNKKAAVSTLGKTLKVS
jgi:hypothetical protein